MEPILTKEELEAVVGGGSGGTGGGQPPRIPERVDLAGGDRLIRALIPVLDPVNVRMAERIRARLTPFLCEDIKVRVEPAEIMGPGTWPELKGYFMIASLRVAELPQGAFFAIDPEMTCLMVERSFGGNRHPEAAPDRTPSAVERRVLAPLIEALADEVATGFSAVAELPVTLARVESDTRALHLESWAGAGLLMRIKLTIGELTGGMFIGLSSAALEPLRPLVSKSQAISGAVQSESAIQISRTLKVATVGLSAVLGKAQLTMAQLISLRSGDVLHLDHSVGDQVTLMVEGNEKFRGRPAVSRGCLSVELEGRIDEEEEG